MVQDYASIIVSGEVFTRDHREHSCVIIVWQDVCDMLSQSFYIHAIFDDRTDSLEMPHRLPELHSPLTFSGALTSFQDGEAIVRIEDHSHFHSD